MTSQRRVGRSLGGRRPRAAGNPDGKRAVMSPDVQRTVLPIPTREHTGLVPFDANDPDASFPPIEPLRPPANAPNVLLILLDDAGFGSASAFGGRCRTPTFE